MTDNSKITGFDTLSTLRFEGFTERNMSELEQILLNLDKSESVQNIKDFYINLYNHLHDTKGHDIDLSEYSPTFLHQLYEVYRRYGNTGSISEMLLQVEKNITVATNKDIDAGFNDTKAVTAKQFKSIFQKHLDNPRAHRTIYDKLVPKATFTGTPTLSCISSTNVHSVDVSDLWCTGYGTIVVKYTDKGTAYSVLSLQGNTNIDISLEDHALFIQINDNDRQELNRYVDLTKDTLVISYKNNVLTLATTKEITEIVLDTELAINTINTGIQTHRLVYYPQQATVDEIRFLLN